LSLQLNLNWDDTNISVGKIIKLYENDENTPSWQLIYTGIIQRLVRTLDVSSENITLEAIGLGGALSFLYYYDSSYAFNKTGEPSTLIGGIITYFNTKYSGLISAWTLTSYWTNADIDFDYTSCLDWITQLKEASDQRFFIDQNGTFDFKEIPTTPTHYLTVAVDVERIVVPEDILELTNKYILEYDGGTNPYIDATSQTNYWLRELKDVKTELGNSTSADSVGNNYISKYKDPLKKITVTVNSNYDIETIKPWHTIKVRNSAYAINNLQIYRTTYTVDKIILELEQIDNLTQQIINS